MNRTFVKAGATAAILAGLMGGVAAVPSVVYADAPAVEQQAVTEEQVKAMVDKIVAARPNVSVSSWIGSKADGIVTRVDANLENHYANKNYSPATDLNDLQNVYAALKPGKNLTLFTDALSDKPLGTVLNPKHGTSNLMNADWVNKGVNGNAPLYVSNPLTNAVNGIARWGSSAYTKVGQAGFKQPVYLQFDLGATHPLKSFTLWRDAQEYANTALVVSDTADFSQKTVAYYSGEAADGDVFKLGQDPSDPYYTETEQGKDLLADKPMVSGRYVRLYLNGTKADKGGESHVLEIAIEGADKVDTAVAYETAELKHAVSEANSFLANHEAEYTPESVQKLKDQVAAGQNLLDEIAAGTATAPLAAPGQHAADIKDAQDTLVRLFHVTFDDKIDGNQDSVVAVADGSAVSMPADPVHPEGYTFAGWFLEKDGKTPLDPKFVITEDLTVYAKWTTKMGDLVEAERPTIPALPLEPAPKPSVPMTPLEPAQKPSIPMTPLEPAEKPSVPMAPIEDIAKKPTQSAMELKPAKKKESSNKDALPQTGDPSMLIAGACVAASAVAFAAARRRK